MQHEGFLITESDQRLILKIVVILTVTLSKIVQYVRLQNSIMVVPLSLNDFWVFGSLISSALQQYREGTQTHTHNLSP